MKVQQFVMAYKAEQDRLRAMLPEGFESLRPVLRINTEIRSENGAEETIYLELNTPVAGLGKRGWLNIANWESSRGANICYIKNGSAVTFVCSFLEITYTGVGISGGCPAEKDNDGCFFIEKDVKFVPAERIDRNKEFCDCAFKWKFEEGNAHGISVGGKSLPAIPTEVQTFYEKQELLAENAAAIECEQILGAYAVRFERQL